MWICEIESLDIEEAGTKTDMQIIEHTTEFQLPGPSAVAIGKFDGVHLGHRKLLANIVRQNSYPAVVFTFDTSATAFFGGEEKELTTKAEKRRLFEEMGIDVLIEFPLNRETAATEPEMFVEEYLAKRMHTAYICAGYDLSFGRQGRGNYELLSRYAGRYGYRTKLIDKVSVAGEEVSSTRVREAVRQGQMEAAAVMLGRAYSVSGCVEHGRKLGRTIGMPTANLIPEPDKLLPPNGVYYSKAVIDGRTYKAISNVGCKPTVNQNHAVGIETYLYDFQGDLYGSKMTVELLAFRRAERKFDDVDSLKRQMETDIAAGRAYGE